MSDGSEGVNPHHTVSQCARSSQDRFGTNGPPPLPPTWPSERRPRSFETQSASSPIAKVRRLPAAPEPLLAFDRSQTTGPPTAGASVRGTDDSLRCLGRRTVACLVDTALLLGINLAVIYLTLRLANLAIAEASQLPLFPLGGFLLLFDLGYVVVLTASGGQTIGKMALGLRVECCGGEPVRLMGALLRTATYAISVAPAGLGCVGVFLHSGRTLHDLIANTRVVKVS